jgi:hypothetical protein
MLGVKQPHLQGPGNSRSLRLPDFKTIVTWRWQDCQRYAPAAFTLKEIFPALIYVRGWDDHRAIVRPEGLSIKNSSDTIGNRTRDFPTCNVVSQTTAPPRAPQNQQAHILLQFVVVTNNRHPLRPSTRQASAIRTSAKGLYMQPQTHTDCTTDCNTGNISFYFIVKSTIF